jgi:hypothetical protein
MYRRLLASAMGVGKKEINYLIFPDKYVWLIPGGPDVVVHHCRESNVVLCTTPTELFDKKDKLSIEDAPQPPRS